MLFYRIQNIRRYLQIKANRKLDGANDAYRVFWKTPVWIANGSQNPRVKVEEPAHKIVNLPSLHIVHQRIDGKIPSDGVIPRTSEEVFCGVTRGDVVLAGGPPPKCRHLDDFVVFEKEVGQSEASSDKPAVAKNPAYLCGKRRGGDIEVFWTLSKEDVPHTTAHEKRVIAESIQTTDHFHGIYVEYIIWKLIFENLMRVLHIVRRGREEVGVIQYFGHGLEKL
jgi:hypothetical protein